MDIPVVQVGLILDADDGDPLGKPLIERFGGASEALSLLGLAFLEGMDINNHPAVFTPVTSPVTKEDVDNSRATGDHIPILSSQDQPFYEPARVLPQAYFEVVSISKKDPTRSPAKRKQPKARRSPRKSPARRDRSRCSGARLPWDGSSSSCHGAFERYFRVKVQLCDVEVRDAAADPLRRGRRGVQAGMVDRRRFRQGHDVSIASPGPGR
jgi:hypothetical protein